MRLVNFKVLKSLNFLNKNNINEAISNFYAAYKNDDSSYESLNNTAALFNAFGKINDSAKLFETGINKHPKNAQIRYNFGTLLFMNNAIIDSKNQLEQAKRQKDAKSSYSSYYHSLWVICRSLLTSEETLLQKKVS